MKNKLFLIFILGVLSGTSLKAQSLTPVIIASSGGYYSTAVGSLSSTVAEMTMVQTFGSAVNFLTQGFQQPELLTASVNEIKQAPGDIAVYPNPSNGNFSITINSKENGSAEISVYNLLGQLVISQQMPINQGKNNTSIDISGSSTGIYFLEYLYSGDNEKKESKVIKIILANQ